MTVTELPPAETSVSTDNVCERGQAMYEAQIRPLVDTEENVGKLLTLDTVSGDYEMSLPWEHMAPMLRLRERLPSGAFYTLRVGYAAAFSRGGHPKPLPR